MKIYQPISLLFAASLASLNLTINTALAQASGSAPEQPGFSEVLMRMAPMFLVVFLVFHFLIIKPQKKKEQEHLKLIGGLKNGDNVVTTSGMLGRVTAVADGKVTLEIASGVKVKFLASHVAVKEEA